MADLPSYSLGESSYLLRSGLFDVFIDLSKYELKQKSDDGYFAVEKLRIVPKFDPANIDFSDKIPRVLINEDLEIYLEFTSFGVVQRTIERQFEDMCKVQDAEKDKLETAEANIKILLEKLEKMENSMSDQNNKINDLVDELQLLRIGQAKQSISNVGPFYMYDGNYEYNKEFNLFCISCTGMGADEGHSGYGFSVYDSSVKYFPSLIHGHPNPRSNVISNRIYPGNQDTFDVFIVLKSFREYIKKIHFNSLPDPFLAKLTDYKKIYRNGWSLMKDTLSAIPKEELDRTCMAYISTLANLNMVCYTDEFLENFDMDDQISK